jgi:ABC-type nickel/cobalt efflux system permease component RcnA
VDLHLLYGPIEGADAWLTGLFDGAPLLVALGIALLLGLRHASDPDHLVAVTSLIAAEDANARAAARLGAWWGLGHASMLLLIGAPLILLKSQLPEWLAAAAEKAVALVILALAGRVLWKWGRGHYRAGHHRHQAGGHRHLRRGAHHHHRSPAPTRTPSQAFGIGLIHGLAGSGAVTVLLLTGLPGTLEALAALAVFAPMSLVSMATFTAAFTWVLTRPVVEPLYRRVLIPLFGAFGVLFGLWYAGIT